MIQDIVQHIATACGIKITRYECVHGGDINECYCLHSNGFNYFLKLNDAERFPAMFEMEADGLEALRNNSTLVVPKVIKHGIVNNTQWLLMEWIEKSAIGENSLQNFGTALAMMHQQVQAYFGWPRNNYIGSLQQINTQHKHWAEFYTQCRIMPLVKILFDKNIFSKSDMNAAESFCTKVADWFPEEPPALLHGDLWSGNYMITNGGNAAIFDPAVYFGHREMDLGMTKLFGGFPQNFYDAYQQVYPLEKSWKERMPLTQLYPLLVHAVLFGGHYIENSREIIVKFAGR